jgi:hypothetical protein
MANATATTRTSPVLDQIHALLAAKRYSVSETGPGMLRIQELESGIVVQAVLSGEILYLSLLCMSVPEKSLTPKILRKMLSSENGISTSHFQLYDTGDGNVAITLANFCKLQEMGPDDEDDILSCVSFLLADVVHARDFIGGDLNAA